MVVLGFFYIFTGALLDKNALATNDAFTSAKHGGADTDGITPFDNGNGPGVDRSVNPDYTSYYHDQNSEAGKFKAGECNQCHDLHGSFGGSEADPVNSAPSLYLAMRYGDEVSNYAELCWYCHENMTLNSNPTGYGYWDFYQGQSVFENSSHYISTKFYWPGISGDPVTIWPRQDRGSLHSSNQGSCLNCHTPHGIMETSGDEFDTSAVPATNHLAANNESVSYDYLIPRQLIAWEEALCENCHGPDGPSGLSSDIQAEINKRGSYTGTGTTDSSGGSGHLVDYTDLAGRHTASESTVITMDSTAGDKKHVECYDCHNPHAATGQGSNGTSSPGSTDFNRLAGMKFVQCDSTDCSGTPTDPNTIGRDPFVHEVCFRCHGDGWDEFFDASNIYPSATTLRPPGLSNKRLEFDPDGTDATYGPIQSYNSAFHPVAVAGNNTTLAMCVQLFHRGFPDLSCGSSDPVAAMDNLTINCTDCHNSEATSGIIGPVTESSLRTTDRPSEYSGSAVVGPHASQITTPSTVIGDFDGATDNSDRSILRDFYFTGNIPTNDKPFNVDASQAEWEDRFRLCFNCHDPDTFYGGNSDTNFYRSGRGPNNLHAYHVAGNFSGGMCGMNSWQTTFEACMTCHYNIHSNIQATNTDYVGGGSLAPDGDTHLVNFAPSVVTNRSYSKPAWYYDNSEMNCNLNCHGVTMVYSYDCSHSITEGTSNTCTDY